MERTLTQVDSGQALRDTSANQHARLPITADESFRLGLGDIRGSFDKRPVVSQRRRY